VKLSRPLDAMENCTTDVRSWMSNNKLKLNDDKTEFLVIGTSKQLSKVSVTLSVVLELATLM